MNHLDLLCTREFFGAFDDGPGMWLTHIVPTCEECPPDLTNDKGSFIISMGADEAGMLMDNM